jgi:peptidyl-tRNA hydrolase
MSSIGQTIIIRTDIFDLPQDMGLLAAQVAHIHMEMTRQMVLEAVVDNDRKVRGIKLNENAYNWFDNPYIFVKKVPNAEGLNHFHELACKADLPVQEWRDTVYVRLSPTMKQAFPDTLVGISIGPAESDAIRTVVGDLPLL